MQIPCSGWGALGWVVELLLFLVPGAAMHSGCPPLPSPLLVLRGFGGTPHSTSTSRRMCCISKGGVSAPVPVIPSWRPTRGNCHGWWTVVCCSAVVAFPHIGLQRGVGGLPLARLEYIYSLQPNQTLPTFYSPIDTVHHMDFIFYTGISVVVFFSLFLPPPPFFPISFLYNIVPLVCGLVVLTWWDISYYLFTIPSLYFHLLAQFFHLFILLGYSTNTSTLISVTSFPLYILLYTILFTIVIYESPFLGTAGLSCQISI